MFVVCGNFACYPTVWETMNSRQLADGIELVDEIAP